MKILSPRRQLLSIPDRYREAFFRQMMLHNMNRIKKMSLLIALLELALLIVALVPGNAKYYGNNTRLYQLLYLIPLLFGALTAITIQLFERHDHLHPLLRWLMAIMGHVFVYWSVAVTLLDQVKGSRSFVYYFIALAMATIVIMKPIESSILYFFSFSLYVAGHFILPVERSMIFGNIVNGVTVILTAWIISVLLTRYQVSDYIKAQIILEQNKRLEVLASTDPLTDLYNRRALEGLLSQYYREGLYHHQYLTVMMVDIDYYKGYNDTYGHLAGDRLLMDISTIMKEEGDKLDGRACRYGGDELCLIYLSGTKDKGLEVSSRLKDRIEALKIPHVSSANHDYVTISVGVYSGIPKQGEDPWRYLEYADRNLYQEKRNRVDNKSNPQDRQ